MDHAQWAELAAWITEAGLAGQRETTMLSKFCGRALAAGMPLERATLIVDTLHPVHEGRVFRWQRGNKETSFLEYGRTNEGEAAEAWHRSPFYRLVQSGEQILRRRITAESAAEFPILKDMLDAGGTDYIVMVNRFAADGVIGEMDCILSSWTTDAPGGFSEPHLAALKLLVPSLALAVKCVSLGRIAETLVETYLGRDAGRRVLSGRIARGVADRIGAVLWFSDLRGYTRITDTAPPEQIIPLLNDYADAVISSIHEQGGDVLKLIGDGTLAIFRGGDPTRDRDACRCGARRRRLRAQPRRRAQRAPHRDRPADHRHLSRPACRRGVLRQCRQQGSPRFHRGRPGRQRSEPDRRDVPLGRPAGAASPPPLQRRRVRPANASSRSAAMRCAASAGRRSSSRWIPMSRSRIPGQTGAERERR